MGYSLGEAAKAVGRTKPTILRAIRAHKISAAKNEATGACDIDPAELHRVYEPISHEEHEPELKLERGNNALHIEVTLLRERLADKDAMIAELRDDRDQWREQAQRLALTDQRAKAPDVIVTPPPARPAPAAEATAPPAQKMPPVVKVKKPPAPKEVSWLRRMMGGR